MSVKVTWTGLTEFKQALRNLPEDLATEAEDIVVRHAEQAGQETEAGYPTGPTGNLKRGVSVTKDTSRQKLAVVATVKSRARHAHIFEKGTGPRVTRTGASRGRMPAAPEAQQMIPKVQRARRRMIDALVALVRRAGFEVSNP